MEYNSTLTQETAPCTEWKFAYDNMFYLVIISGAMIGIINSICVAIFENIVFLERCQTYMEETVVQLQRIVFI
jgi:hypothetical protein